MKRISLQNIRGAIVSATLFGLLIAGSSSCYKKVDPAQTSPANGAITLTPTEGTSETIININGNGFPDQSQVQVTVNGKAAQVVKSTSNQIQARVAKGSGTGDVIISLNGTTQNLGKFTYYFTHYTVTSLNDPTPGYLNGPLATAEFDAISAISIDANDNVYVAGGNPFYAVPSRIRKVSRISDFATSMVTTLAGSGTSGDLDAQGESAYFGAVRQLSTTADGTTYFVDRTFKKIKKIDPAGNVTTLFTVSYVPEGIKVVKSGNIYLSGPGTNTAAASGMIQKYNSAGVLQWTVYSHGPATAGPGVDGDSSQVVFFTKNGIEVDSSENNLYFVHLLTSTNYGTQIKVLNLKSLSISTLAGDPTNTAGANSGDGDYASAGLNWVTSMALDEFGGLYIADYFGFIKYINNGTVRTIITSGGSSDSDGDETTASNVGAWGIARDSKGNFVYTDFDMNKLKYLTRIY